MLKTDCTFFYGLKLSIVDKNSLLTIFLTAIENNVKIVCYGYSFGAINLMRKYHQIYLLGNSAEIVLADGRPFYIFCKMLNYPLISDISIPNAVFYALELADKSRCSVLLLGANQEINNKACETLSKNYINIKTITGINGYFNEEEEDDVVKLINNYSPDIILIGMNSPKKENFVLRNKNNLNSKIIIPCGGMIDVLGGKTKVAPSFIKKIGLASFYRLIQEPRRLFKRHMAGYLFITFKFLPILFFNIITKNKEFNIPSLFKI